VAALAGALALGALPAPAAAARTDVSATHIYIQARYTLARKSVALIGPIQARIEAYNSRLARECPNVAAGAPQSEASVPISGLVVVALWSLTYGAAAGPIQRFVHATARLHWSNRALARATARYGRSLQEMASLPMPDLCAVIRQWRASGFQTVPAGVAALVSHAESIELNPVPAGMFARFEGGGDAATMSRALRLEEKLAEAEFVHGVHDVFQVLATLALPQ
jgi:hypothetical protein